MALILASTGAIVLISIIFTIQYLQTRAKIEEFAREAHDAEAQGKYDQAKTWWDKILTLSPEDAVALEQWRHCDELAENPARTLRELQTCSAASSRRATRRRTPCSRRASTSARSGSR